MTRGWKIGIAVAASLLVLNLVLGALRSATGGTPGGPADSSYATAGNGAAAYASLLVRAGHEVIRERVAPHRVALQPGETVVVLDAPFVLPEDVGALRQFLVRGGRLIASPGGASWLQRLLADPPEWGSGAVLVAQPIVPVAELRGVRRVTSAGAGAWLKAGRSVPVLGDRGRSILDVAAVGRGRALLLADASPIENRYLADADNARLGSSLAGHPSRPVVFFENYHGYGRGTGLSAVPGSWRFGLLLGAFAALVFMLARIRRFGPPEAAGRAFAPSRREYVDALAASLARTRDRGEALAPIRRELRERIARRSGLPAAASDADIGAAAMRLGLSTAEVQSLLRSEPPFDELAIGRAFARTTERRPR